LRHYVARTQGCFNDAGFGSTWEAAPICFIIRIDGGTGEVDTVTRGISASVLLNGSVDFMFEVSTGKEVNSVLLEGA
jgi:hypothetical protein